MVELNVGGFLTKYEDGAYVHLAIMAITIAMEKQLPPGEKYLKEIEFTGGFVEIENDGFMLSFAVWLHYNTPISDIYKKDLFVGGHLYFNIMLDNPADNHAVCFLL